jgi:tetratricopeptide (TPR) repeat protein
MEHQKAREHDKAIAEFAELTRRNPEYVAGYFMWGRSLEQKGDVAEAKAIYGRGILVARKIGDNHAASEMTEALEMLE